MSEPACERCRWWVRTIRNVLDEDNSNAWRSCLRFPPTIIGDEYRGVSVKTHCSYFCGEFQAKEVDDAGE